uniref:NACHT, LRR and PYD domains-containing protein 5 n=1 Tax=Maylandia zebra TaxID=106582 RepID=UPI000D315346|nr:NACHT, LRR and PYD domains-containing protein 5 [Maylandia zebra]
MSVLQGNMAEFQGSSSMSMNSDKLGDYPPVFSRELGPSGKKHQQHKHRPQFPGSSSVSMNSDMSRDYPPVFSHEPGPSGTQRKQHKHQAEFPGSSSVSMNSDKSREYPPVFSHEPGPPITQEKKMNFFVEKPVSCCVWCQDVLKDSSTDFCPQCGVKSGTRTFQQTANTDLEKVFDVLKVTLRTRYEHVIERTDKTGIGALLRLIYTELYITEEQSEAVHFQHEVRQVESACKKTLCETPISSKDIFKTLPDQQRPIRVVLTYGVAGIGKTFLVQKFTLDWAEGLENQHISAVVLLSFRELNLVRDEQYSLLELIHVFYPTLQSVTAEKLTVCNLLFIFDGLDESRLLLDFTNRKLVSDVTQKSTIIYMFHCYTNRKTKVLQDFLSEDISSLEDFLGRVMEESLVLENNHLELFVRFLHGLALKSNQIILGGLLGQTENSPETIQRVINNLKELRTDDKCPERCLNIFHCLMEMKYLSLHQEIQEFLKSQNKSKKELSGIECTALAYMLLMSENFYDELDLKEYKTSKEGRRRLLPAVMNCRKARFENVTLSENSCAALLIALKSNPPYLKRLDLIGCNLEGAGMKQLYDYLESPHCKLQFKRSVYLT